MQIKLQPAQYYTYPAVTRYFDHIQNQPSVRKVADRLASVYELVPIDIENAPKLERKPDATKVKKAKDASEAEASAVAAPSGTKLAKEKKVKEKGALPEDAGKKKSGNAGAEESGDPVPSMIDLRVGRIIDSVLTFLPANSLHWIHQPCSKKASRC